MVEYNENSLDMVFGALADPTRRALLTHLVGGEQRISDLAEPFEISLAGVSKHIQVLEKAGLIERRVEGRTHYCRFDPTNLENAYEWLAFYQQFWTDRLDALEKIFTFEQKPKRKK
ncbi:MAG: metalloregulator ArsR/SmtB family transcription factor [Pseudomonadota bacterium]